MEGKRGAGGKGMVVHVHSVDKTLSGAAVAVTGDFGVFFRTGQRKVAQGCRQHHQKEGFTSNV